MARPRAEHAALEPALAQFVAESPLDRPAILAFISRLARELPPGARVLDAGAGNAPYRPLFTQCHYVTSDWEQSAHGQARNSDVIASLDRLPLEDRTFDVVVNTQVLEHVNDPATVLGEFRRVLVPTGELWLTAPFVWELHEEPFDYFRYTSHGLRWLLHDAGFEDIEIEPLGGYFATLAQLLRQCGSITGLDHGGIASRVSAALVGRAAPGLARLDLLDRRRALPLGYACRARRPQDELR